MATYCISDIHGCYDEFMALLEQIQFNPENDTLYILGDAIDRGDRPIDCLLYIKQTKGIHFIMGNHEKMMLDYHCVGDKESQSNWHNNGCSTTIKQFEALSYTDGTRLLGFLRSRPFHKTIRVNDRFYFLSHAGLDASLPFNQQMQEALTWSREEFYEWQALPKHTVIFGHTPTMNLRDDMSPDSEDEDEDSNNCSVWLDKRYHDKICIDCGCVYGGALAALRLDDGAVFYVKSNRGNDAQDYFYKNNPVPAEFFDTERLPRYQRRRKKTR